MSWTGSAWLYAKAVLTTWNGMLSWGALVWLALEAATWRWRKRRLIKAALRVERPVFMVVVGLLLLCAPYSVWRGQGQELLRAREDVTSLRGQLASAQESHEAEMRGFQLGNRSAEAERSRRVRERLGQFVAEADSLARTRGPRGEMYLADGVYPAWAARVERYLRTCGLEQTYRVRFIGAPGPDEGMSYSDYGSAPNGMKRQRDLLVKFIEELLKVE